MKTEGEGERERERESEASQEIWKFDGTIDIIGIVYTPLAR